MAGWVGLALETVADACSETWPTPGDLVLNSGANPALQPADFKAIG